MTGEARNNCLMQTVAGLHHITAIAGPAQENLDFYAGVLGMRLVKRSVNQDDPGTYHLFYADAEGHPGSDLTFLDTIRLSRRGGRRRRARRTRGAPRRVGRWQRAPSRMPRRRRAGSAVART